MPDHPTPAEAAHALREAGERRDQAFASLRQPRWIAAVFGVAVFLCLAAPDFSGSGAASSANLGLGVLSVGYAALLNTRRGSSLLGRPTRLRKEELSPRFATWSRVVLLLAMLAVLVASSFLDHLTVPYWRTAAGVLLGGFVIFFGARSEQALLAFARRDRTEGNRSGVTHGSR